MFLAISTWTYCSTLTSGETEDTPFPARTPGETCWTALHTAPGSDERPQTPPPLSFARNWRLAAAEGGAWDLGLQRSACPSQLSCGQLQSGISPGPNCPHPKRRSCGTDSSIMRVIQTVQLQDKNTSLQSTNILDLPFSSVSPIETSNPHIMHYPSWI